MGTKITTAQKQAAIDYLRELFPPGATVTTHVEHVSRSGMQRGISVLACSDGLPRDVSWAVGRVIGAPLHRAGGVKVDGCGMDMGFRVVYALARALYADGFRCTGHDGSKRAPRCPSNDHSNAWNALQREAREAGLTDGDEIRAYVQRELPRTWKRGRRHSDPGYALNHRWLS